MEGEAEQDTSYLSHPLGASEATKPLTSGRATDVSLQNPELDQSARNELEAEAEKMRSLGQLAAGVAHDFNNALAAIVGRTQLLLRLTEDERLRRHLRIIETAALDAAETVSRIQNFARRTHRGPLKTVAASSLVADTLQLTRTRWEADARARGVRYDIDFRPWLDVGDSIHVNPSEVREVLVNLVLNALDAMPHGGRLSLRVKGGDEAVLICVRDTGEGIAPDVLERIFEPFFTTKGTRGSGLGLAVSYGIIRRHGSQIEVESEVGSGTLFTLRFARAQEGESTQPVQRIVPPRLRVLVVEDEDSVREVLVEILEELKQEVVETRDVKGAVRELKPGRFDLIITDLSMPGGDGLALAAEARRITPATRIVLATGYGQTVPPDALPDRALIDHILGKPFQLSDLEAILWTLRPEAHEP